MASKSKSVKVTLSEPQEKKHVVRFDADADDAAISNVYVSKDAIKKLGNPSEIVVTIEAA